MFSAFSTQHFKDLPGEGPRSAISYGRGGGTPFPKYVLEPHFRCSSKGDWGRWSGGGKLDWYGLIFVFFARYLEYNYILSVSSSKTSIDMVA